MLTPEQETALRSRFQQIPIMQTLPMEIVALQEGRCTATLRYEPRFNGIFESLHGGLLTTLADTMACLAIITQTGPDEVLTTTDLNMRFLRACLSDARVEAKVIKLGRTLCPVQVEIFDTHNKLVAIGQVTYMRLPQMPERP